MANQEFFNTRIGKKLLLHAGKDATNRAFALFDDESFRVADPTGKVSFMLSKDLGMALQGPISLIASPEEIRVAGLWKINPLVIAGLPSTVYTPVPWLRQSIPTSAAEVIKGLTDIATLLA